MTKGYTVLLRRNSDGEVREYHDESEWGDSGEYYWLEGNASCDCNRHLFFAWANGEKLAWDDGIDCSDGLYTAIKAILPDGAEVMLEGDATVAQRPGSDV